MFSLRCRVERHGPHFDLSGVRANLAMQILDGPKQALAEATRGHEVSTHDRHAKRSIAQTKEPRCVTAREVLRVQVVRPAADARAS